MISQDKVRYLHFTKIRDTTYILVWLAMLAVSSLEAAAAVPKHDDIFVTIAEGGKAKCVIVVGDKATSEEKRAASQIQDVLLRDGGEMPRLLTARNRASLSSDLPLIVIGTLQTNPLVSVIAPDAKNEGESLSLEGFRILTTMYRPGTGSARTRTILIWSKTARGVLYGATEFTDYVMRPDAERRVRVGHTNLRRNPHFSIRGTYNLSCWGNAPKWSTENWEHIMDNMAVNQNMNRIMFWMSGLFRSKKLPNTFLDKKAYLGTPITDRDIHRLIAHAHSLGMEFLLGAGVFAWLAANQIAQDFPETKAVGTNAMNPSSARAQQLMMEYLLEMYDRFPEADGFMLEIRDEYGECHCQVCQTKLDEYGSKQYGQSELDFLQKLAEETWKRNPKAKLVWLVGYDVHNNDVMYYDRIRQMRDPRLEWLDVRLSWNLPASRGERRPVTFFSRNFMHWRPYYVERIEALRENIGRAADLGLYGYCPAYEPGFSTASYYYGQIPEPIDLIPFNITSFLYRELTWQPELTIADLESRAHQKFFTPEIPRELASDLLWLREFMLAHAAELSRSLNQPSNNLAQIYESIGQEPEPQRSQDLKAFSARLRILRDLAAGEGDMQRIKRIEQEVARSRSSASERSVLSLEAMARFITDTHTAIENHRSELTQVDRWLEEIQKAAK